MLSRSCPASTSFRTICDFARRQAGGRERHLDRRGIWRAARRCFRWRPGGRHKSAEISRGLRARTSNGAAEATATAAAIRIAKVFAMLEFPVSPFPSQVRRERDFSFARACSVEWGRRADVCTKPHKKLASLARVPLPAPVASDGPRQRRKMPAAARNTMSSSIYCSWKFGNATPVAAHVNGCAVGVTV